MHDQMLQIVEDFDPWVTSQSGEIGVQAALKQLNGVEGVAEVTDLAPSANGNLVILSHFQPELSWIGRSLDQIRRLPENWDGYGAECLDWLVIRRLGELLSAINPAEHFWPANIVPGADGSVQAEWHLAAHSTELCVDPDQEVSLTVTDRQTGELQDFVGEEAISAFERCLAGLRR